MIKNNNLKICRTLVWRDFRLHRAKNFLMILAVALITGMYTFTFLLGGTIKKAVLLDLEYKFGSDRHILYAGLTETQVPTVVQDPNIKDAVRHNSVGRLSVELPDRLPVKLAVLDQDYVRSTRSVLAAGRLPERAGEIVLDEITLDSLGIRRETGRRISVEWTDVYGMAYNSDFILCGWLSGSAAPAERCAWIVPECAEELIPGYDDAYAADVTLGVTLYRPGSLQVEAREILAAAGVSDVSFTTNPAYAPASIGSAGQEAFFFYLLLLPVLVCGVLMVYGILHTALEQEIRYFAGLKMSGTTPRQLSWLLLGQATLVTLLGLLPGWLMGSCLHLAVTPRIAVSAGRELLFLFPDRFSFPAAALCGWGTVLLACFLPIRRLERMMPAQAVRFSGLRTGGKGRSGGTERFALLLLAYRSMKRDAGRTVLSAVSLMIALSVVNAAWIQYASLDEELYLSVVSPWDYSVAPASLFSSTYLENNDALTHELVGRLTERPEVVASGTLKSRRVELTASPELRELLLDFYNGADGNGRRRRDTMEENAEWTSGLRQLETTGVYTGIIVGLDGIYLDYLLSSGAVIDGEYRENEFAEGGSVLTSGAFSEGLSSLPSGAFVELGGRRFRVGASLRARTNFLTGSDGPRAEFCLYYYIPVSVFDELFPGQTYRQAAINIDHGRRGSFEAYLAGVERESEQNVSIMDQSAYRKRFQADRFRQVLAVFVVGAALFIIGLFNFINTLVSRALARKRESAIYESLGMTRGQLLCVSLLEGTLHALLLTLALLPSVFLITWLGMPALLDRIGGWCVIYRYSLSPLWAALTFLMLLAVLLPAVCMKLLRRGTVAERLKMPE